MSEYDVQMRLQFAAERAERLAREYRAAPEAESGGREGDRRRRIGAVLMRLRRGSRRAAPAFRSR